MATTPRPIDEADRAALTLDVDDAGIAWLVFDRPDSRVNLLTAGVMARLDGLLAEIEEDVRRDRVRAVVVRSGKPGHFIAGADVNEIAAVESPDEAAAGSREGQRVFRRFDRLTVPSIAAIDGACMGGGTELALACTYRLATDRDETRIGTPEVRLGIIPAWGGTSRLPRLIGLREALPMLLTGRAASARKAGRIGLVDEVVPAPILVDRAHELARERMADGNRRRAPSRGLMDRLIDGTPVGRRLLLRIAERRTRRETRGRYPAPLTAIAVLRDSLALPLDDALEREAAAVGRLAVHPVARNLIHIFQLMDGAKRAAPDVEPRAVERVAVLGAGVMGGGIGQLLAYNDLPVRIKDIRQEAIGEALRHANELFDKAVRRRKLSRQEADERMAEISPTLDYSGFGAADLVIEAVVEALDVKKRVLREAEQNAQPHCVLASNTSALSITEMQHAVERPENLCGMHFFNPVHRMPLVEIVRGADTSAETIATVFALARRLGKTPVIVNDGPGFLVNRLLAAYLNEAGWLLADGMSIRAVDRALLDFGMPMGPFRLLDEVGLDVARHVSAIMYDAFGDRMEPAPPILSLERTPRLGRKGGRGFYRYKDGDERGVDEEVYDELGIGRPPADGPAADEIVDRSVLRMVDEAARALADGIAARAGDVDLALITGTGFPPFRGGLLRWADHRGVAAIVQRLDSFAREHGPRFQPATALRQLAVDGTTFYERFQGPAAKPRAAG